MASEQDLGELIARYNTAVTAVADALEAVRLSPIEDRAAAQEACDRFDAVRQRLHIQLLASLG